MAGTTPGIDPRFAQVFSRNKISGKYLDINHNLVRDLKEANLWDEVKAEIIEKQGDILQVEKIPEELKKRYKSAFTTSPYAFIEIAARAQKWVDQALSRNMYLETRVTEEIMDIYKTAWEKGLKTTYYLHMKPRHTAEQSTVDVNKREKLGKIGFGMVNNNTQPKEVKIAESVPEPIEMEMPNMMKVPELEKEMASVSAPVHIATSAVTTSSSSLSIKEDDYEAIMAMVSGPRSSDGFGVDPQEKFLCDSCQ